MRLRAGIVFALSVVCMVAAGSAAAGSANAQSMRPEDLARGRILITPRDSPDPHFSNSVIVLASYDASGALGLMLHYRSDLPIQKALKGIAGAEKRTDPVYIGGPVELPVVLALLRTGAAPTGAKLVAGNLYLMTSRQSIGAAISERPAKDLRVFIGYSGWGPGQLQREVQRKGWYIFDYDESLVFDEHPETLWERLIAKTGRSIALLPTFSLARYAVR
jgi:putative transcriptional regulator